MSENFTNPIGGVLANDISSGATSFDLVAGGGNGLPTSNFRLTLTDGSVGTAGKLTTVEVIWVTTRSGDSLSGITRGYESSIGGGSARAWTAGTKAYNLITAGMLQDISDGLTLRSTDDFTLTWAVGVPMMVNLERLSKTIAEFESEHPKVKLCDGTNGTLDMTDRFVIGASSIVGGVAKTSITGSATSTGGSKDAVVVEHTHETVLPSNSVFIQGDIGGTGLTNQYIGQTGGASNAESGTNKNLPPYVAVAFFERIAW